MSPADPVRGDGAPRVPSSAAPPRVVAAVPPRPVPAAPVRGERVEAERMERMIDAVQALSRQLAVTQQTLLEFVEHLAPAAMALDERPPAVAAVPAPRAAIRPAVGVPVRRPAPSEPVDPNARPAPPPVLADHVWDSSDPAGGTATDA